jgi:hypothetical protein
MLPETPPRTTAEAPLMLEVGAGWQPVEQVAAVP